MFYTTFGSVYLTELFGEMELIYNSAPVNWKLVKLIFSFELLDAIDSSASYGYLKTGGQQVCDEGKTPASL